MSRPLALLVRVLAVLLNSKSSFGLGWTDICNFTGALTGTSTCNIWNGNEAPFNNISAVLNSPVCRNGCVLQLNPFSGSCTDNPTCSVATGTIASPAFTFDTTLTIAIDGVTLRSMDENTPVQIGGAFTAIMVTGQNVNLVGLDFTAPIESDNLPLSDLANVVWKGGGNVQIASLTSSSSYTVVLFVGITQFLNLTANSVVRTPITSTAINTALPISVIILQAANISLSCGSGMASNSVFFLGNTFLGAGFLGAGTDPGTNLPQSCLLNLTNFTQIAAVPAFPACNAPETIQLDQNCPNPAIFATLIAILSISAATFVIPLVFMYIERLQRKMHSNSVSTTKTVAS